MKLSYYWRKVFGAFQFFGKMFLGTIVFASTFFWAFYLLIQGNVFAFIGFSILGLFLFSMVLD